MPYEPVDMKKIGLLWEKYKTVMMAHVLCDLWELNIVILNKKISDRNTEKNR